MMAVSRDLKKRNNFSIDAIMSTSCSTSTSPPTCSCPMDRVPLPSKGPHCSATCPAAPRVPPIEPCPSLPAAVLPGMDYDAARIAAVTARAAAARTTPPQPGPWGVPVVGSPLYGNIPSPLLSAQVAAFPPDSIQAIQAQMYSQHKQSVPFYNWFLARQSDYFGRVLQETDESYLFGFRKPKRIRTAFSPDQLIQLEQAFELNHYVVGQERKELAAELGLSETQVKVWFQNRRTKFKRVQTDEDEDSPMTSPADAHVSISHQSTTESTMPAASGDSNKNNMDVQKEEEEREDEEEEFVDIESPQHTITAPPGDDRVNYYN